MSMRHSLWMLAILTMGAGCAEQSAAARAALPPPVGTEVRALPETATPMFVDFGGKLRLVGYELSGELPARAGAELSLDLYWESAKAIEPGWQLTTELSSGGVRLGEAGKPASAADNADENASPAGFRLGRIYRDQHKLQLPDELPGSSLTILAAVSLAQPKGTSHSPDSATPSFHVPVLSGPSDGEERGVVAHVPAVAGKLPQKAKKPERERRRRNDAAPSQPRPAASGR
jgi:hypothetical protein